MLIDKVDLQSKTIDTGDLLLLLIEMEKKIILNKNLI